MPVGGSEYLGIMKYLSVSGASLVDVATSSEKYYMYTKQVMFGRSQAKHFEPILDKCRQLILSEAPGCNVVRYLLHTLNNKVIKRLITSQKIFWKGLLKNPQQGWRDILMP